MSMQQALGVVGGIVGSFFGMPQLGFVVGSLIGAALTPGEKTEGPRLDDLKVTVSTYGNGIPLLYGTERMGGNVIWSTDKIEVSTTEEQGKGGGAEYTTYKYYVHMAIALCETPRDGSEVQIIKIFKNGKLIGDNSPDLTAASAIASVLGTGAPSKDNSATQPIIYQGHADQLPDPTMEAWMGGPGSVAAYRGIVYILMPGVECPNGQVPQFSFVLSTNATMELTTQEFSTVAAVDGANDVWGVVRNEVAWHMQQEGTADDGNLAYSVYHCGPGYSSLQTKVRFEFSHVGGDPIPVSGVGNAQAIRTRFDSAFATYGDELRIERIGLDDGSIRLIYSYVPGASDNVLGFSAGCTASFDFNNARYAIRGGGALRVASVTILTEDHEVLSEPLPGEPGAVFIKDDFVYALTFDGGILKLVRLDVGDGAISGTFDGPAMTDPLMHSTALHMQDGFVYAWVRDDRPAGVTANLAYRVDVEGGDGWTLLAEGVTTNVGARLGTPSTWYCDDVHCVMGPSDDVGGIHAYSLVRFSVAIPNDVMVSDSIADLCERVGETRYDVSGIPDTDLVHGYKISNVASARANIQPLLDGFGIYAVDEDGLIKFKKRSDLVSVATVSYDELGQAEDGSEPGDPMPLNHTQEIDLPRSATVSYIEPSFDYQTASEPYYREVTDSIEDMVVDLPIALTSANQAKQVAQWAVFERALAQNSRTCKLSRKYAFVSPGDGLTIEYPRGTWSLWFVANTTDTGALCEFTLQPGDAQLMTQTAIGATGYPSQVVTPLASPQRLELGDMPILQDADNNAGIYAFMEPYGGTASGAELFVGDDDSSLQSRGTVDNAAVIGFVEGVLGDWEPNIMDETNTMIVNIGEGELNSTTRALIDSSTINAAAIGVNGRWEIIQFLRASSLGDGRYLLSGLVRGMRGSEHNRGNHEASDKFILLSEAGTLRPNMDVGQIGQTKSYRAISKGRSRDSDSSQTYANTAEGLMPFSPWDLRKSKAATNDQTLTAQRRTRMSSNAFRGVIPLGETTEAWSWRFYTSGAFTTLAGTFTSTTGTLTLTSAEQTAIGLTPGAQLHVDVALVSESVGRGHALQESI